MMRLMASERMMHGLLGHALQVFFNGRRQACVSPPIVAGSTRDTRRCQ